MTTSTPSTADPTVALALRPERRLIRAHGSFRHVDGVVSVAAPPRRPETDRPPLALALVLDRSGSMHGAKIDTARRATIAVLDRLDERDQVAAVIFDDRIDVLQQAAPASREVKARLRAELQRVEARGSTALHEGWLTGCKAIAPDAPDRAALARCFLLTDGLANVGVQDPEQIASDAAGIRANADIGTSTFGIGDDYDESLLGPLAVAGGGQFHHLRTPDEIATTFVGELGELLAVAARRASLQVEAAPGTTAELISPYWMTEVGDRPAWSIQLGDLLGGEERHVVVRFGFLGQAEAGGIRVRARVAWVDAAGQTRATDWQEVAFEPADHVARGAELADRQVLRVVGVHHAERAQREAIRLSREGDVAGARALLRRVASKIAEYAGDDPELREALARLRAAERDLEQRGYAPAMAKEAYFASQTRSRGQRDLRRR